ncbi:protein PARALOG OF AIPP2-like isoform X2 [Musa acuminata AAA Group]|uniref:protein PARALOG OF AIPP2-like isoform X2 n=1 Tax=Musa acuminata AAA Group TaxID=214697 RepID=UPI0031D6D753
MRNRRDRALAELYDATESLSRPEITPILQGTCHIQGPVDEYDYELQGTDTITQILQGACHIQDPVNEYDHEPQTTNLEQFPVETKCLNILKGPHTSRAEPGTCNVCSAPCSSCLHFNRLSPLMESKIEDGQSDNISSRKEDDSSSCIAASGYVVKSRVHDKLNNAFSETSHLSSSSYDSSIENAESKELSRASEAHDASDNVVVNSKVSLDAAEDNNFLHEETSYTTGNPFVLNGSTTSELHQRKASAITVEKNRQECHIENNSHISGFKDANNAIHACLGELGEKVIGGTSVSADNLLVRNDEKAIQKEAAQQCNNSEIEENQKSSGNGKSSVKNSNTSSFRDDVLCQKIDNIEDPCSSSNISLKAQFPCSGSSKNISLSQCSMDDEKPPVEGKLVACNVDGKKDITLGVTKEDSGKSQPQLISLKDSDECLGAENGDNSRFELHVATNSRGANQQSDKPMSNSQSSQVPSEPNSMCEVSTEIEDDVKVCDICGDAGQEELLAICSRCSDGAEHTYCMRIMLDKVPEGEWLCEECQLKEAENQMIGKSEAQTEAIEAPSVSEYNQITGSTSNSFPCVENKGDNADTRTDNKELGNSNSFKRKGENLEVTCVTKEKISEACGASTKTTIPMKPTLHSHENSSNKPDFVKVKPSALITSCGQPEVISQPVPRSQTSSVPDLSKPQAHLEPTRGPLSKSASFNNSKVPKVKQLVENIPQNKKMTREFNSSSIRKEGPLRTITKSASFRSESSGFSSVKTMSKVQSLNPPQPDDPRGVKQQKERSAVDLKGSIPGSRFVSPSASTTSISPLKVDSKVQQNDPRLKRTSDSGNLGNNKGSNDAATLANDVKKQPSSSLSQTSACISSIRSCKNEDQKPFQLVPKAAELTHRDDKTKDHTFSSNSRQAASASNRLPRCHRCNETGHSTQFCAVDKLRISAMKPSSERSLRDMDNRNVKSKDGPEVLGWKLGTKRTSRSPDQSEEVSLCSADANSELTAKDFSSSSLNFRNLPSLEGTSDVQNFSKATNAIHAHQKVENHKKAMLIAGEGIALDIGDDLNLKKPIIQTLSNEASIPMHPLRASVIPELDYIWQGAFEVLRTAEAPTLFDGFQAHLSTYVSPKALEVASQFPCKIQLEEIPRLRSWPLQFHINSPKDDNIALFFFAKDIESYGKYYWKLLENMLKNDLALIGNIDTVELLIFPSNMLPENSQRWNKLFYLWGVFRGRKINSLVDLPGLERKPSVCNLNSKTIIQDLPTTFDSGLCCSLHASDEDSKELSESDRSPKEKPSKSGACTDPVVIPSGNNNGIHNTEKPPIVQKTLCQVVADDKVLREKASCLLSENCSFKNINFLPSTPIAYPEPKLQIPSVPVAYSEPKFQIDIERLPSEIENDLTSPDNLAGDSDSREVFVHHVPANNKKVSDYEGPTCSVSLNCGQGNDSKVQNFKQKVQNFITSESILNNQLSENVEVDRLSWKLKPNQKRAQSISFETIKNSSGCMLKRSSDVMLWKDEASFTSLTDEKVHKKTRLDSGGHLPCISTGENLSSSISSEMQPLLSCLTNDSIYCENVSESLKNAERHFFPIDPGPQTSTKADNLVYVLSSDDEDSPESNAPDLELGLGRKKRPIEQDIFPLLSPKVGEKSHRDKMPASAVDCDDLRASLSLSLAFPASEKAQTVKPIPQAEQLLPDKPCINTLLLFGGYKDSEHG